MTLAKRLISRVMRRTLSKFDALYQRHAGEECYVFGNGISLKWMDLHGFADRVAISGGVLIYHKDVGALRDAYYALTEPFIFYPIIPSAGRGFLGFSRNTLHVEILRSMREHPETLFLINVSNYPVTRFRNVLHVSRWHQPPFETHNPFRDRADSHDGTLAFQLSLAIYLGFKRAYLVGHDYTHVPARNLHFYEKGEGIMSPRTDANRGIIDYARQHIELVTVTLDGRSESMDYITYKELTGKDPSFRENLELVDRVKLESLAQWDGYTIF